MNTYGLLGYPLSHSFSPGYFKNKFEQEGIDNAQYLEFEYENIIEFIDFARQNQDLIGFNITIPYKEDIIAFVDELDEVAATIGAINTVKKIGDQLIGYNTDAYGFRASIEPLIQDRHQQALILGTGGASKAVQFVFEQLGIPFQFVSRTFNEGRLLYEELTKELIESHQIIVNSTPLGMYPNVDNRPNIPYQYLNPNHLCYDLIYNPEETQFLSRAKAQGAIIKNGLEMLHLQAEKSWTIWTEKV